MQSEFTFALPTNGKTVVWRPLTLAKRQDTIAAFANQNRAELDRALYMARIVSIDGNPFRGTRAEWNDWEEVDFDAFTEEVEEKESARRALFATQKAGGATTDNLKRCLAEVQSRANEWLVAFDKVMSIAKSLEMQDDPLATRPASGPVSTP